MPATNVNLKVTGDCQIGGETVSLDSPLETIGSQTFNNKFSINVGAGSWQTVVSLAQPPTPSSQFRKLKLVNRDPSNSIRVALVGLGKMFSFTLRAGSTFMLDGNAGNDFEVDDDSATPAVPNTALTSVQAISSAGTPQLDVFYSQT